MHALACRLRRQRGRLGPGQQSSYCFHWWQVRCVLGGMCTWFGHWQCYIGWRGVAAYNLQLSYSCMSYEPSPDAHILHGFHVLRLQRHVCLYVDCVSVLVQLYFYLRYRFTVALPQRCCLLSATPLTRPVTAHGSQGHTDHTDHCPEPQ